jgi:hypothetical protein
VSAAGRRRVDDLAIASAGLVDVVSRLGARRAWAVRFLAWARSQGIDLHPDRERCLPFCLGKTA